MASFEKYSSSTASYVLLQRQQTAACSREQPLQQAVLHLYSLSQKKPDHFQLSVVHPA